MSEDKDKDTKPHLRLASIEGETLKPKGGRRPSAKNKTEPAFKLRPPPPRRSSYTCEFTINEFAFVLSVGEFEDGTPCEIKVDLLESRHADPTFSGTLDAFGKAASLLLQAGMPLDMLVNQFIGFRFEPLGSVTNHEKVFYATSIVDMVMKDLASHYLSYDFPETTEDGEED